MIDENLLLMEITHYFDYSHEDVIEHADKFNLTVQDVINAIKEVKNYP